MRKLGPPSEIGRLASPILRVLDGAWQRMHWWIATMAILYAVSGITVLKSDEVAVILRWGRLVGDTPALQQHGPGLLFAFPRPIDEVVRVQVKRVHEIEVTTLDNDLEYGFDNDRTLDPITQGYALTGDQNVVHVKMIAHFRVRDPAQWAFYGPKAEDVLRVEVTSAMMRSLGEMGVDRVLSDGRKELIATTTRRAQAGLDAAHSGLELSSLELVRLAPPKALASAFDSVQSAFIGAQTATNEAHAFRESTIPKAQAEAEAAVEAAKGAAAAEIAVARGESQAFLALSREYRANPGVVRERLYRDALDRAISSAGDIRWLPPPVGGSYHGLRISLSPVGRVETVTGDDTDSLDESPPPSSLGSSGNSGAGAQPAGSGQLDNSAQPGPPDSGDEQ